MPKIFVADVLAQEGLALMQAAPGLELDIRPGLKGAELKAALDGADGCIVRSGVTLTPELLAGPTRLKAVVRAGVGVDNIDVAAATRQGIVVMNTPGGNTLSTAEQTWAMLLALARHIAPANASLHAGKWDRKAYMGTQLAGKHLAVVGLGRVGLAVAKRGVAFEMDVCGYDPFMTPERAAEHGVALVPNLEDIFARADVLTVHVPLSAETTGLVNAARIARMPKGAYVLNCARGGIVDEAALHAALASGHLGGAALDVFAVEPLAASPFFGMKNVVLTPHLGASTAEAQVNVSIEAAELLLDFFRTGNIRHAVNMPSLDAKQLADVRRHLDIAYRLGLLMAQTSSGAVRRAELEYRGDAAKKQTRLIASAFSMGLMSGAIPGANLVNAAALATDRGLTLVERISAEPTDFATLVRATVHTDPGSVEAAATTRGAAFNRLVRFGPYRFDAYLEGTMLFFQHRDEPGIIGFVGTALGRHGVNIAQMTVGRCEAGGAAVGVLALDAAPPEAALQELRNDPRITDVRVVVLPPQGAMPPGVA